MASFQKISSFQNAKVKQIKKLRDRKGRVQLGRFVVDSDRDLARALDHGFVVDYVLCAPELETGDESLIDQIDSDCVFEVSAEILQKASYRQNPSSVVAVLHIPQTQTITELREHNPETMLVLVDLRKPGNIGALLRSADAAGIDAIILVDTSLDLFNPNVIRASTGACFLGNVFEATTDEALAYFASNDVSVVAAVVNGNQSLYDVDFSGKVAIAMGTEDQGLDDVWSNTAGIQLRIPMMGTLADSLNVSVSGALIMYEALRQRQKF